MNNRKMRRYRSKSRLGTKGAFGMVGYYARRERRKREIAAREKAYKKMQAQVKRKATIARKKKESEDMVAGNRETANKPVEVLK